MGYSPVVARYYHKLPSRDCSHIPAIFLRIAPMVAELRSPIAREHARAHCQKDQQRREHDCRDQSKSGGPRGSVATG